MRRTWPRCPQTSWTSRSQRCIRSTRRPAEKPRWARASLGEGGPSGWAGGVPRGGGSGPRTPSGRLLSPLPWTVPGRLQELSVAVVGSQLVGLVPLKALLDAAAFYCERENLFILEEEHRVRLVGRDPVRGGGAVSLGRLHRSAGRASSRSPAASSEATGVSLSRPVTRPRRGRHHLRPPGVCWRRPLGRRSRPPESGPRPGGWLWGHGHRPS